MPCYHRPMRHRWLASGVRLADIIALRWLKTDACVRRQQTRVKTDTNNSGPLALLLLDNEFSPRCADIYTAQRASLPAPEYHIFAGTVLQPCSTVGGRTQCGWCCLAVTLPPSALRHLRPPRRHQRPPCRAPAPAHTPAVASKRLTPIGSWRSLFRSLLSSCC
jgi:hypothetical protein